METERIWVAKVSLIIIGISFGFYIIGPPLFGFPISFDETARVTQIIVPVFVAYLSTASAFLFASGGKTIPEPTHSNPQLFRLMVRGPVYLVGSVLILATAAFWYSNRKSAPAGSGMSLDNYCWWLSSCLGILNLTTGVIVGRLFPGRSRRVTK